MGGVKNLEQAENGGLEQVSNEDLREKGTSSKEQDED